MTENKETKGCLIDPDDPLLLSYTECKPATSRPQTEEERKKIYERNQRKLELYSDDSKKKICAKCTCLLPVRYYKICRHEGDYLAYERICDLCKGGAFLTSTNKGIYSIKYDKIRKEFFEDYFAGTSLRQMTLKYNLCYNTVCKWAREGFLPYRPKTGPSGRPKK